MQHNFWFRPVDQSWDPLPGYHPQEIEPLISSYPASIFFTFGIFKVFAELQTSALQSVCWERKMLIHTVD